jgi:hypothetical protein
MFITPAAPRADLGLTVLGWGGLAAPLFTSAWT